MKDYNGFPAAQRLRALAWAKAEERAGRRSRPTRCCACGQTAGVLERHSEDYSEPFGPHIGAFHLCYFCHRLLHCRSWAPDAFRRYVVMLEQGWMVRPASHNWGHVLRYAKRKGIPESGIWQRQPAPPSNPGFLRSLLEKD